MLMRLNNITFRGQKQGEIFGLLGPNGAGKTTFLSILAGTVVKTNGKVNVWGLILIKIQVKSEHHWNSATRNKLGCFF